MIEDKLTHGERLRLECVAQAVAFYAGTDEPFNPVVLDAAGLIEAYVIQYNKEDD